MDVQELQDAISQYPQTSLALPKGKKAIVRLPKQIKYIDICVLSNIQVGFTGPHTHTSKVEKPFRIQKLKAHIEELSKNPNARVMLGGDLFYFPGGGPKYREMYSPSYEEQAEVLAQLLEPIKDKIIGAYDGTDEQKIFEKDGVNPTALLMQKLGMPDRYFGQMAEVDFLFKNDYTNGTSRVVSMLFDHGFLVANVLSTVAKKTEGLQSKLVGKDFYFTSHYNKLFIERTAVLAADSSERMVKKPCYFVSVGGYRDYPNRLTSNRNVAPANTDNGMIRVFVAPNPDRSNIRGNNYLGEPTYKVCQEFINFGRTESLDFDFDLIAEISRLNEQNLLVQDAIIAWIQEKVEQINKQNAMELIQRYYAEVQTPPKPKQKTAPLDRIIIVEEDSTKGGREE